MINWTNKQLGALIGFVVVFVIALVGFDEAALAVLGGVVGYFIGKYLDGEIDPEDVRERVQRRRA
jgi:uncharacterized protein YcfJ